MWDVRARKAVYELATGNNMVASLAWDSKRSSLYAATECGHIDRLGFYHDYRKAHIPNWAHRDPSIVPVEGRVDESLDVDEEFGDDNLVVGELCWPDRAYHGEDHFGYAFDSGEHRLCELSRHAGDVYILTLDPQSVMPSRRILIQLFFPYTEMLLCDDETRAVRSSL